MPLPCLALLQFRVLSCSYVKLDPFAQSVLTFYWHALLLSRHNARDDDDDEDEEDSEDGKTNSSSFSYRSEPFESRERRAYALAVLDRPEQLMMYANTTNDVRVPSSRLPPSHTLFLSPHPFEGSSCLSKA